MTASPESPTPERVPALRSRDRPRLPGRVNGAFGVARDGASATIDPSDQPSKAAATKGMPELCDRSIYYVADGSCLGFVPPVLATTNRSQAGLSLGEGSELAFPIRGRSRHIVQGRLQWHVILEHFCSLFALFPRRKRF
jgi:hypothetical protein